MSARNRRQDATLWVNTGSDGYSGFTFATPKVIKVRWEERSELFITNEGEQETSSAVVYLGQDVANGDFLALGIHDTIANPGDVAKAYRVRGFGRVTDLRSLTQQWKAFL